MHDKEKLVRARFERILSKKFTTCFIAALDKFESTFGEMWGFNENNLTAEQIVQSEKWQEARTFILNNGNKQLRSLTAELLLHKLEYVGYKTEFVISDKERQL